MPEPSEFQTYVLSQLEEAGDVHAKRMFGGLGVYVDEVFCAILTGAGLFYLRVDDGNRGAFEERGMQQMKGRGKAMMPYFQVPAEVLEDAEELAGWVVEARAAAERAKPKKGAKARKKKGPKKK